MTQQQYTPVSWQDETTSQQGTLINAERLNQMQTAHHYADGLEETDTVPTADPGVAYHKIVYCTADSTIYRWDGTQWTADIDDPTRELLEEHEADHDNPHQVTKAQVGLGNADNTSDADKPISTATQTALNAKADKSTTYTKTEIDTVMATKADKATTLAGYGITDAYTKTEADTLLGAKANDNAVVHKAGAETIEGVKTHTALIKFQSAYWRGINAVSPDGSKDNSVLATYQQNDGTYRAFFGQSGAQIQAIDATEVRCTHTLNASSNPACIATLGYIDGYHPMVRTTGNQTIAGIKTFSSPIIYSGTDVDSIKISKTNLPANRSTYNTGTVETNYLIQNGSNTAFVQFGMDDAPTYRRVKMRVYAPEQGWKGLYVTGDSTGVYVTAPARTYDTTHTDDVVTIGTLKASTDVVHTSGIEDIAGDKRFLANMAAKKNTVTTATAPTNSQFWGLIFTDKDNKEFGGLRAAYTSSRDNYLYLALRNLDTDTQVSTFTFFKTHMTGPYRAYNASNVNDVATIGTLDAYTPMVRTSGNQGISGIKTFTDPPAGHRTNSRTNAYAGYYTIMKLGLRGDGTNRQVLGGLISQHFGIIQINEPNATSINVTDLMGTFSSLLDFALYTDGSYHYVAVKQKTNNTFAYELGLMAANKGNYGINSGDIQVYYTLSAVNSSWTLVASTEGA